VNGQSGQKHTGLTGPKIGNHALLFLVVGCILFLVSIYALRFVSISRLQGQVAQVRAKQILALQEQSVLRERLAQKDDLQAIEDVAREELGLVKPGEQLIIFVKGE
jgi:cell division protein FtsB